MSGQDQGVYLNFTCRCTECGTEVHFLNGERVPSVCGHELPAVVIGCADELDPPGGEPR